MKKNRIVFINQSSGYLMIDIVNAFKEKYDERILMTGFLNPRNKPLDPSVKIEKLAKYKRESSFKRLLTWSLAFIKAIFLIWVKYRDAHLFLVTNPPFTVFIPLFCRNSYSFLVYDIYPDALEEFNILKKGSLILKFWKRINKKVFNKAEKIFTISEGMKQKVSSYTSEKYINVVKIWTDNSFLKPLDKNQNKFLLENNLQDKFIVMYSGNLGKSHPVEVLVKLAKEFNNNEEIIFLIVGEGEKKELLQTKIKDYNLSNILLLPWQPTEMLPYSLAAADIAVVTLNGNASDLSIPSKTYNFLSVGVPVMGICKEGSGLFNLIVENKIGGSFESDDLMKMVEFINRLYTNTKYKEELKSNALRTSDYYSPVNVNKFLENV